MKKILRATVIFGFFCTSSLPAQVLVNLAIRDPMPPPLALLERERTLIQAVLVNTTATTLKNVRLSFVVRRAGDNKTIVQSIDEHPEVARLTLRPNATVACYVADIYRPRAVAIDPEADKFIKSTKSLPPGDYQLCVKLLGADGAELGAACENFSVVSAEPPQLLAPADGDMVSFKTPVTLSWAPAGAGKDARYRLTIAPVFSGQNARTAIERNVPLLNEIVTPTFYEYLFARPMTARAMVRNIEGFAWQVQILDASGRPIGDNLGKSAIRIFQLRKNLPDFLIAGSFTIAVEAWDKRSKSRHPALPSGIGRIRFSCLPPIIHPRWDNIELIQRQFEVVNVVADSLAQLSLEEARNLNPEIKLGEKLQLDLPLRARMVDQRLDRNALSEFFKKKPHYGIRVAFREVRWSGPATPTVILTEGLAWYPALPAIPPVPAQVMIAPGFTLTIDSLTVTPAKASVAGSILLPSCLISAATCTRAALKLPPTAIAADCKLYCELPDSTFGAFFVGETGLQIQGRGYTLDFSNTQSDPRVTLPNSWKGVVFHSGETSEAPADTVTSNRGYVKAKYDFTNGLVTASGLEARLNLRSPFTFRTIEPFDYLVDLRSGYLHLSACGIRGGQFQNGMIRLPLVAVRDTFGNPILARYDILDVQSDMDLFGPVEISGGFMWGEFFKTAGSPRFYQVNPDAGGTSVAGYFYLAARQMKPYYPLAGANFATPTLSPFNTQLETLGIQGVTIPAIRQREFTIWTQDVPVPDPNNRKLVFPPESFLNAWMNFIGTGVHTEIRILKPRLKHVNLGPTWATKPPYQGEVPLEASFEADPQQKRLMTMQFVESATWDSDFNGTIHLDGPINDDVAFNRLIFTSTANAGGAELDLSTPANMDYWGVQLVPKDPTESAGVVCVKLGVIYLTAAGISEPRHFDRPFFMTWGELKASGNLGRLFFDYNNVGQRFDRFPYTPHLVALSPYNPAAPADSGHVQTWGAVSVNFFGAKMLSIGDWKAPHRTAAPYNGRTVRLWTTPHLGAGVSDLHWERNWADGVASLDFTSMQYDSLAQEGFVGSGTVSLLRMITFESLLSATISVKAERSCFSILQENYTNINLGPLATASQIGKLWGCGCIIGESLERIAVGGELSVGGGVGLSILGRGAGTTSVLISYSPTQSAMLLSGDFYLVVVDQNVELSGFASLIVDRAQGYVEGYLKGRVDVQNIASGISGQGEFDWHIGLSYQFIQGRVGVSMYQMGWPASGAGLEAGLFLGINAPKERAWVMDGISGRFGLNKAALPANLTGFYVYTGFSNSVSLYVVSGGYQVYVGTGAFVGTGAPVTGFAFGVIGNVGVYVWGEILGGVVSASAWGNLQMIVGVPPAFEGSLGLEACVLFVFCGSATVHGGFNADQGFYLY